MTDQMSDEIPWLEVMGHYDVGQVEDLERGGGTASAKRLFRTSEGRYLLKRRREMNSDPDIIRYDHGVIAAVHKAGLPTVEPVSTRSGRSWVSLGGCAYELFPYVGGLVPFDAANEAQLVSAARCLARFHRATANLTLPGYKPWPREHHIGAMIMALEDELPRHDPDTVTYARAQQVLEAAHQLVPCLNSAYLADLSHVIIHGDYTPANVLYRGDAVGGIFDFDWVSRQPRLIDVGEALQFFAFTRPEPIDPDSIWSLVQGWQADWQAAQVFLAAYQDVWPLSVNEAHYLPRFMLETWIGIHVRAMRKVPARRRLEILLQGTLPALHCLQAASRKLESLVIETTAGSRHTGLTLGW